MDSKDVYNFGEAKEEYRIFCETGDHDLPVFAQPWYLDAACGAPEGWRVILYKENGAIKAAFPFAYTKGKYGLWHIHNPRYARRLGVWIDYGEKERPSAREAYENKIVADIVSKLPYYDEFNVSFDARFQNWQQFYRMGFHQTSHYSYIMRKNADLEQAIPPKRRKALRSLEKQYEIGGIDVGEYFDFFEKSYEKRGRGLVYTRESFFNLYNAVHAHDAVSLAACRDQSGVIAAVACIFYDSRRVYKMANSFDPSLKSVQPLLTLYSIRFAQERGLDFDHEGSMIPGVADYNRDFGSIKEPYFIITNYSDKYRLMNGLRESAQALGRMVRGKGG